MSAAGERELLVKALSGDWHSRAELFARYVWKNDRVRRHGFGSQNMADFLQDCFTNLLRTGHSFAEDAKLSEQVEMVARWTALDRDRRRELAGAEVKARVRMCAPPEEEGFTSYVPPRVTGQTLQSTMVALIGDSQLDLLRKRNVEQCSWDDAAQAIGVPATNVGPMFVKAVERLTRFFGAPPPLNIDLESVFAAVDAENGVLRSSDPKGRVISMQLDPLFYALTPEMRRIGLGVPDDVRTITLWDAAKASAPPDATLQGHLANCRYCAELTRSMMLAQQALISGAQADFLVCPSALSLVRLDDEETVVLDPHLDDCAECRVEQDRALAQTGPQSGRGWKWFGAGAAALLVLAGGLYFAKSGQRAAPQGSPFSSSPVAEAPSAQIAFNSRYADLAQKIRLEDNRILASTPAIDQDLLRQAITDIKRFDMAGAMSVSSDLIARNEPMGHVVFAVAMYAQRSAGEGYAALKKAEAMAPRDPYRCWIALQGALIAGDRQTIEREANHLAGDREFGPRANEVLLKVRERK